MSPIASNDLVLLPFSLQYYRAVWNNRCRLILWMAIASLIVVLRVDVVTALSLIRLYAGIDSDIIFQSYANHTTDFRVVFAEEKEEKMYYYDIDDDDDDNDNDDGNYVDDYEIDGYDDYVRWNKKQNDTSHRGGIRGGGGDRARRRRQMLLLEHSSVFNLAALMDARTFQWSVAISCGITQLFQHGLYRVLHNDPSICYSMLSLPMLLVIAFPPFPSMLWVIAAVPIISIWPSSDHLVLLFGFAYAACAPVFLLLFGVLPNLTKYYITLSRSQLPSSTVLPIDLLSMLFFYLAVLLIVLPFLFPQLPFETHYNRYGRRPHETTTTTHRWTFYPNLINARGRESRSFAWRLFRLSDWLDRSLMISLPVLQHSFSLSYGISAIWFIYYLSGFLVTMFWRLWIHDEGSSRNKTDNAWWRRYYSRLNFAHHLTVGICMPVCALGHALLLYLTVCGNNSNRHLCLLFAAVAACGLTETVTACISAIEHNQFLDARFPRPPLASLYRTVSRKTRKNREKTVCISVADTSNTTAAATTTTITTANSGGREEARRTKSSVGSFEPARQRRRGRRFCWHIGRCFIKQHPIRMYVSLIAAWSLLPTALRKSWCLPLSSTALVIFAWLRFAQYYHRHGRWLVVIDKSSSSSSSDDGRLSDRRTVNVGAR